MCLSVQLSPADSEAAAGLVAQHHVLPDAQVSRHGSILQDRPDAGGLCLGG